MKKIKIFNGPDKIKNILYPPTPEFIFSYISKNKYKKLHKNNILYIERLNSINKKNNKIDIPIMNSNKQNNISRNRMSSSNLHERNVNNEFLSRTKMHLNRITSFPKDLIVSSSSQYTHRNYGKTPEYVKKFKIEAEVQMQEKYIKYKDRMRLEEEATYPKGSRLMEDSEKISLINKLIEAQKSILIQIEKMPISNRSLAIQNKKNQMEKKLIDLDEDIQYLKKRKVFVLK